MTHREIVLLILLSATVVWRVLWSVERSINPPEAPAPVVRVAPRAAHRSVALAMMQPARSAAARAPLSPFLWVRPPPRPLNPPPSPVAVPAPPPEPSPPLAVTLPPWLFAPPTPPPMPVAVVEASPEDTAFAAEEEADAVAAEENFAPEWAPPPPAEMIDRYRSLLDPFGAGAYGGWVSRGNYPYWMQSEGLNYMPDYLPHHHHDTGFEFRLTPRR
jgi:hypothetical protein